jgi:hypothetical protein
VFFLKTGNYLNEKTQARSVRRLGYCKKRKCFDDTKLDLQKMQQIRRSLQTAFLLAHRPEIVLTPEIINAPFPKRKNKNKTP